MITVQQIFDMAIHLMDEQNESSGVTQTNDTAEYRFRTISILNTVMPALYPYSDTCDTAVQGRPVCPMLAVNPNDYQNPDFSQQIPLDDTLAASLLPYALAGHLLSGENESLSLWFLTRYNQAFADLRNKVPAEFQQIHAPYGLF